MFSGHLGFRRFMNPEINLYNHMKKCQHVCGREGGAGEGGEGRRGGWRRGREEGGGGEEEEFALYLLHLRGEEERRK